MLEYLVKWTKSNFGGLSLIDFDFDISHAVFAFVNSNAPVSQKDIQQQSHATVPALSDRKNLWMIYSSVDV